jgi:protease II
MMCLCVRGRGAGVSVGTGFREEAAALLARGALVAYAHVRCGSAVLEAVRCALAVLMFRNRGGGEQGPAWHAGGRGRHKHRAADDTVAVARDLVRMGATTPIQLLGTATSAGGAVLGPFARP